MFYSHSVLLSAFISASLSRIIILWINPRLAFNMPRLADVFLMGVGGFLFVLVICRMIGVHFY